MKVYLMFGQRPVLYEGELGPEALDFAWDEYCVDDNPEGFEEAVKAAEEKAKKDGFLRTKLFAVEVDSNAIDRALNKTPVLKGTVSEVEDPS